MKMGLITADCKSLFFFIFFGRKPRLARPANQQPVQR